MLILCVCAPCGAFGEGKDVEIQAAPWVAHHVLEEGSLHPE